MDLLGIQEWNLDSSLQPAKYLLPKLPSKAKSRLNHHGFREQDSKIAEERFKKLKAKIDSLNQSEEQLWEDQQQRLRSSADEKLSDASRTQKEADAMDSSVPEDVKNLYAEATHEFQETQNSLKAALGNLGKEGQCSSLETTAQQLLGMQREKEVAAFRKILLKQEMANLMAGAGLRNRNGASSRGRVLKAIEPVAANDEGEGSERAEDQEDDKPVNETDRWRMRMLELELEIQDRENCICDRDADIKRLNEYSKELERRCREEKNHQIMTRLGQMRKEKREAKLQRLKETILVRQYRYYHGSEITLRKRSHQTMMGHHHEGVFESRIATDSSLNKEDNSTEPRSLKVLERLISDAQILETCIQKIQEHCKKLEDVINLKQVLEKELELERKWLDYSKGVNSVKPDDNPITHLIDKYFFSSGISNRGFYDSLERDEFRVLVVAPAPEPFYPLVCKLETWPITNAKSTQQQYAALSYVWGRDELYNGRIYLLPSDSTLNLSDSKEWGSAIKNATPVPIRNNLFRALLRLRRHGHQAQPVALWVDFLCIDQENSDEKTYQLPKMVDIYRNAGNVCIWLGESDDDGRSDEAMEFISTIVDLAVSDHLAHDKSQARKWYALGELMRDRWFSRRWVVQEIALAKEATVHCGGSIVRWSDFADAASLLVSNQETIRSLFDLSEWREGQKTLGDVDSFGASILLEATNNLFRRKPNGDIKKPIKTIESLVTSLRTFDTGDQRDLIYSLVGIAEDTSYEIWNHNPGHGHENPFEFKVDYSQSKVAVYNNFTRFCVSSSGSLDIICRPWAMLPEDGATLPSWIPLLSNSEFGVPEEVYSGRKNGEILVGPAGSPNYEASGKTRFDGTFELPETSRQVSRIRSRGNKATSPPKDEGGILIARGFRLARIGGVSPRNTGGLIFRESLEMLGWEGFKRDTVSVPDIIWRTLVADRDQGGHVPPLWYQKACLRCLEIADKFNNGYLNIGQLLQDQSDMVRKYLTRVRNVTWNRCFFTADIPSVKRGSHQDVISSRSSQATTLENIDAQDTRVIYGLEEDSRGAEEETENGYIWFVSQENSRESGIHIVFMSSGLIENREEEEEDDDEEVPTTSFGLCPPNTQAGDLICILYGCTVPVILREGPDGYMELVGEAYVHGQMDGEAMEEFQENDAWEEEEFRIR
ncbi:heterokaryon incompatibility protein-domain-containing protein [Annulohypoxylon maeteangense]|uniref:heterokaryon incompatibility protein-domain-containing protein n=1 Tax=Annulohypoxylon maeteangense TaxID=1927788 RepID=UPI0020083B75|nr:heterokaryon incompatibility protein-domain-containing protein [Annulohypoxylon maeteangense]KAI0887360.1 heterokaryon incompatibility protein-domain-containing protein [Annulohypoxylon maeteangense]